MAVELARMALWLEGVAENKPLSFIDHHLKVGNSLLGVMDLDVLKLGIPDEAYKPQLPIGKGEYFLTLSDENLCAQLSDRNSKELKIFAKNQLDTGLNTLGNLGEVMAHLGYKNIDELTADTLTAEQRKAKQNERNQKAIEDSVEFKACNLLLAAFLSEKTQATEHLVPTTKDLDLLISDPEGYAQSHQNILDHAAEVCAENYVMHWPFAFKEVMAQGGFDCVLGNPPWEKFKVEEDKWFAPFIPEIACEKSSAVRKDMIDALVASDKESDRATAVAFVRAKHKAAVFSTINHLKSVDGGRFPLTGIGDTNLSSYFSELALRIKNETGAAGMVLPVGVITDDSTKLFSQYVFSQGRVSSVYHFNNTESIFPNVHNSYSFVLLTLGKAQKADCVFYATNPTQLEDGKRHLSFESSDIELFNPNTRTLLLVRSEYDLELCRKIYKAATVLVRVYGKNHEDSSWHVQTMTRMFHRSGKSSTFVTLNADQAANAEKLGMALFYESKLFNQFDHRYASFTFDAKGKIIEKQTYVDLTQKQDASFIITPNFWVKQELVNKRWLELGWTKGWALAWRNITGPTNERTMVVTVLPANVAVSHSATVLMPHVDDKEAACLMAMLNSIVVDFVMRLKLSGTNVSLFYAQQLPVLPPEAFKPEDVEFIASRVAMLTRTADDINAVWLTDYPAYTFQEPRERLMIRAQLDAYIAKMYGLTREELQYILDPSEVMGPDHPSVTFPVLKRKEIELYGEYLTQRLVLTAYDAIMAGMLK